MNAVMGLKSVNGLTGARAHCLASALIARYCSVTEAYLAGLGKESRDLVTAGDAQWTDWRADRAGVGCARRGRSDDELAQCCAGHGY